MKVITEINEETFPIGEVIRLGYNCVNVGEFLWETTKHEGDRVRGRFLFSQDKGIWSDERERLDSEWRNLMLEETALAEHSRVQDLAKKELEMKRPDGDKEVVVTLK